MSLSELHQAFVARRISRGAFIRRLIGFGMSLPVAGAYALALEEIVAAPGEPPYVNFCEQHPGFCQNQCAEQPLSPLCGRSRGGR